MKAFLIRFLIVLLFAVTVGHLAFRTWGPAYTPKFYIENQGQALIGPESDGNRGKFAYFRHTLNLPQRPRQAWLNVIGRDRITAYVNGQRVGIDGPLHSRAPAALALDITPYMRAGRNSIAIAASQVTSMQPPVVAIDGGYLIEKHEVRFQGDESWRCSHAFSRGKSWWFSPDFDDRKWSFALVTPLDLRGQVYVPPTSISAPRTAKWLSPRQFQNNTATVRREFELQERPQSAWIRIASTAPYRLAVNGVYCDTQEKGLGLEHPLTPALKLYDITPALQRGANAVAIQLNTNGERPHALADIEVITASGVERFGSDERWLSAGGLHTDWAITHLADSADWDEPLADVGDLGLNPALFTRETVYIDWPTNFRLMRLVEELAVIALIALLAFAACQAASSLGRWQSTPNAAAASTSAYWPYLALVLPGVAILCALLTLYDPRCAPQALLQPHWIWVAFVSVPAQWVLVWLVLRPWSEWQFAKIAWPRQLGRVGVPAILLAVLLVPGAWLRLRHLTVEPIHHDEVSCYWFTRGVLETGFPGGQVAPDTPYGYAATSELAYYPTALVGLFIDDPVLILRIPSALWSIATIWLLYFVGRKMFDPWVGLIAATIYTFSPYCFEMSNFGRYFAQLQFFTLLTSYYFWRTIEGSGPINRRALWGCGATFLAMYYSWEGSGFLCFGMILAAFIQRRGNMRSVFLEKQVWLAMLMMVLGYLIQDSHRVFQQTQRLWYGIGISDLELYPMWRYPNFVPTFYFVQLSWVQDAIVPMILLIAAVIVAVRSRWQDPLRGVLAIVLGTCGTMTALLPLRAARYTYHLIPLAILASAVVLVLAVGALQRSLGGVPVPVWARRYAVAVGTLAVCIVLWVSSGMTYQFTEMHSLTTLAYRYEELKFPHWEEPLRYVREHLREGDVVIGTFPHIVDHTMYFATDNPVKKGWKSNYWLQSTLILQATLDDKRSAPLDRRAGTMMLSSLEALQDAFARSGRIWFLVSPGPNNGLNDKEVNAYVRKHMDVVYEDYLGAVMFRDSNHRPTRLRDRDDFSLRFGQANFLP